MNQNLTKLQTNNKGIIVNELPEEYQILNPWNDKSVSFSFPKVKNLKAIKNLQFPEQLVALFDTELKSLEFIYGIIEKENKISERQFDFLYKGNIFKCNFGNISNSLSLLAKSFKERTAESATDYRNLRFLRDILTDKFYKEYFQDHIISSFYVQGNFENINYDYVGLSKSLNFYMAYFDRNTPRILIHAKNFEEEKHNKACMYELFDTFPSLINAVNIDSTLLDTFMVANQTENIRLKFIFYFQILEYASYYYLDGRIQNKILQTFKNPSIFDKPEDFSKSLIEELKDHFSQKDDSIKLEKTITENISIEDIRNEISANKDFFAQDLEFEGGLKINKILKDANSVDNLKEDDLILIKKNIERIRNVLVHLRESRENKVILPSASNNNKLLPYLFVLRRIAEKVAINFQ